MRTLYDFKTLSDNAKFEAINEGTFIEGRQEGNLNVQLYSLTNFYAEVFYDPVSNQIVRIRGFKSNAILAKYIKL